MRRLITMSIAVMAAASVSAAQAQSPLSLELRGGPAFPTADFGSATLNTGAGAGVTIGYAFMPHTGVYAGWDWFRFTTDAPFVGADYDVENTGYAFGIQFQHPINDKIGYWARAGGLYAHIELENDDGDVVNDSGHQLGAEVGVGASVPFGNLELIPGLRYRTLSADLEAGGTDVPVDLSYFTVEIGLRFSFGGGTSAAARSR